MRLNEKHAPFNMTYLQRMMEVISYSLNTYPQTTVIRVDLHLPQYHDLDDSIICLPNLKQGLISRFIDSLKAKIKAYLRKKIREGKRTHSTSLRYLWVREQPDPGGKSHYHLALFVNTNCFNTLGCSDAKGTGLASLIQKAWLSALDISDWSDARTLVHIPDNPLYYLSSKDLNFKEVLDELTYRLSYMAKHETKSYGRAERSFGCSSS